MTTLAIFLAFLGGGTLIAMCVLAWAFEHYQLEELD